MCVFFPHFLVMKILNCHISWNNSITNTYRLSRVHIWNILPHLFYLNTRITIYLHMYVSTSVFAELFRSWRQHSLRRFSYTLTSLSFLRKLRVILNIISVIFSFLQVTQNVCFFWIRIQLVMSVSSNWQLSLPSKKWENSVSPP